jgi:hypothetical protein
MIDPENVGRWEYRTRNVPRKYLHRRYFQLLRQFKLLMNESNSKYYERFYKNIISNELTRFKEDWNLSLDREEQLEL